MPGHSKDGVAKLDIPLVAVGGSAGSVDALVQLFELMPEDCGIAFIVAIHLTPTQESLLPMLLQRHCALKVMHARDNLELAANHVYVIPPGRVISCNKDRLKVEPLDAHPGRVAVIDVLFASLAEEGHGPIAGILLSGADSDGATGLERISKADGLTLVQDPLEAQQEVMPRAAIERGCTDAVLRVASMPERLLANFGIAKQLRQAPAYRSLRNDLPLVLTEEESELVRNAVQSLRQRTGRDFSCYREAVILRHLQRRMEFVHYVDGDEYLQLLEADAAEPEALVGELLVSVTEFFRDADAFAALALHIPELFQGKGAADFVRVWVPACATGEEAYSIAILLLEHAQSLADPPGIQVFGCDLDRAAIEKARAGLYRASTANAVGPERLQRFFQKEADGYRVRRELRQIVLFAEHDVVWDPHFARMDLISCRNLQIYLNAEGQQRIIDVFDLSLGPNGLLFLGPVEGPKEFSKAFVPIDDKHRIYRRSIDAELGGPGFDAIQRSVAIERVAYGRAARLKGGRASASLNELQNQLDMLQQRLRGIGLQDAPDSAERRQLQVITHELHATLEELDVNRQELRSMNAELTAVNQVLSEKLGELEQTNADLNNLMNAASIPMVFLNRELKIMRYTPRTRELFRLIPTDIGRPLSDLHAGLDYPALMEDAELVLNGGAPIENEVRGQSGKWFFARILPYYAQQDRIAGVVLTFYDITERKQSEAALKASEQKLRTFISATSEIVYEMSADWLEMCSLAGKNFITTTEIPRVDWTEEYIPEDEKPRVWSTIKKAIQTRSYFELEHRVIRIDGSTGWVFSRAIPILDEQGAIVKWFGTASDITERKLAEQALSQSEGQYRKSFDLIDEGFCVIEVVFDNAGKASDYRFLQTNAAVERQTGIENAAGRWMREIAPRHEAYWFEMFGRIAQTGEPMRFQREAKELGRFYDVYAFRVGEPALHRVGVLFNDITARRRSEEALRADESRLRLALETAGLAYYEYYPDEDLVQADQMLSALFGLPAGTALARASDIASMVHPDDRERLEEVLRVALDPASGGAYSDEVRVQGQDGKERWLAFNGRVEFDADTRRPKRLSCVVRDVTREHN